MKKISALVLFQAGIFSFFTIISLSLAYYIFYQSVNAADYDHIFIAIISLALSALSIISLYGLLKRKKFGYYTGIFLLLIILLISIGGILADIFILLSIFPAGLLFIKSIFILALIVGVIFLSLSITAIITQLRLKERFISLENPAGLKNKNL